MTNVAPFEIVSAVLSYGNMSKFYLYEEVQGPYARKRST